MNKTLSLVKVFMLATFLIVTAQSPTFAANSERLEIVNGTGKNIKAYYLVQAGYKDWGNDRVGGKIFGNGQTRIFNYDPQFRYFKLRIVFTDGNAVTWQNDNKIDFHDLWRLTIYYDGTKYRVSRNARG